MLSKSKKMKEAVYPKDAIFHKQMVIYAKINKYKKLYFFTESETKKMKQNYYKYIQIKEETYNIFEIYHHQALVNIFKSNVSAKDLSLLKNYCNP